jgi:uncharacterized protein (DUF934 family)
LLSEHDPNKSEDRDKKKILRRKQKEQEQREHLLRQLRGKVQPDEWHNTLWLALLCLQLVAVAFCAFLFGNAGEERWA